MFGRGNFSPLQVLPMGESSLSYYLIKSFVEIEFIEIPKKRRVFISYPDIQSEAFCSEKRRFINRP